MSSTLPSKSWNPSLLSLSIDISNKMLDLQSLPSGAGNLQFGIHFGVDRIPSSTSSTTTAINAEAIFKTYPESPFQEDAKMITELSILSEQGQEWIYKLYTLRSVARTLPQLNKADETTKHEFNVTAFSLLRPRVDELTSLMRFTEVITEKLCITIATLSHPLKRKSKIAPKCVLNELVRLFDVIFTLDHIKDMKAPLQNDFTSFKRFFSSVKSSMVRSDADGLELQCQALQTFLADPLSPKSTIIMNLKRKIHKIPGADTWTNTLLDTLGFCVAELEANRYLLPEEKWRLIRFLPHVMFLLDAPETPGSMTSKEDRFNPFNVFKNKRAAGSSVTKIFKRYPVVPLFGDMHISLIFVLDTCPNFLTFAESPNVRLEWGGMPESIQQQLQPSSFPTNVPLSQQQQQQPSTNQQPTPTTTDGTSFIVDDFTAEPFGPSSSSSTFDDAATLNYELVHHWRSIRSEYDTFSSKFASLSHRVSNFSDSIEIQTKLAEDAYDKNVRERSSAPLLPAANRRRRQREYLDKEAYECSLEGIKLLCKWKELILAQVVFKYSRGASQATLERRRRAATGQSTTPAATAAAAVITEYERVVRYNYSQTELNVLFDVVTMLKSLASSIRSSEKILAPCIKRHVHLEIQQFAQLRLLRLLHRVHRKNRKESLALLLQLRAAAADWLDGKNPEKDDYKEKNVPKKINRFEKQAGIVLPPADQDDSTSSTTTTTPTATSTTATDDPDENFLSNSFRASCPSKVQLLLFRSFVEALYDPDKTGSLLSSIFSSEDIDRAGGEELKSFFNSSFFYPYVISLSETCSQAADLSNLWYREFYLEMSRQVQFPIDSSLPYILTREMIENPSRSMIESIFYVLDVYNDAADFALMKLKQRHLFDEIEAEASLVFEQLVFLLGDHLYTYSKSVASASWLDKSYRARLQEIGMGSKTTNLLKTLKFWAAEEETKDTRFLQADFRQYRGLLSQRFVRLLGRSVDLSALVAQQVSEYIRQDVDACICRFESMGLSSAPELKSLLQVVNSTHSLLAEMGLNLDSFDDILDEMDEHVSPTSFKGRIVSALIRELIGDVLPNHAYLSTTERFVPPPPPPVNDGITTTNTNNKNNNNTSGFVRPAKSRPALPNFLYGVTHKEAYEKLHALEREFVGAFHFDAIFDILGKSHLPVVILSIVEHVEEKIKEALLTTLDQVVGKISPTMDTVNDAAFLTMLGISGGGIVSPTSLPNEQQQFSRRSSVFGGGLSAASSTTTTTASSSLNKSQSAFDLYENLLKSFISQIPNMSITLRALRELGNGIVVLHLLQGVVDRIDARNMVQSSHLWNEGVDNLAFRIAQSIKSQQSPATGTQIDLLETTRKRIMVSTNALTSSTALFENSAGRLAVLFQNTFFYKKSSFLRLWCGLEFLYCLKIPTLGMGEFGDGFLWAGIFGIHALGLRHKFHILDPCPRVARLDMWNPNKPELIDFLRRYKGVVEPCIDHVFSLLEWTLPIGNFKDVVVLYGRDGRKIFVDIPGAQGEDNNTSTSTSTTVINNTPPTVRTLLGLDNSSSNSDQQETTTTTSTNHETVSTTGVVAPPPPRRSSTTSTPVNVVSTITTTTTTIPTATTSNEKPSRPARPRTSITDANSAVAQLQQQQQSLPPARPARPPSGTFVPITQLQQQQQQQQQQPTAGTTAPVRPARAPRPPSNINNSNDQ
jgi:hypothetical protein